MAVGLPLKTTYANGDVYSASDVNDTNGTINITAAPYAAGKNKIINGDFSVWQRGTSFTSPASGAYSSDRWRFENNGTGTATISQQAFTPGAAPVAGYESSFFLRLATTAVGTSTTFDVIQRIESVNTFANQTITISFFAKADSARTVTPIFGQNFGSGGSGSVFTSGSAITLTTSFVRYSATITIPSISGKTIGANNFLGLLLRSVPAASSVIDYWGVQVEAGSTATAFQTATGTIQGELAACQRYYYRLNLTTGKNFGSGMTNTTDGSLILNFPVTMRTSPTSLEQSGTAGDYSLLTAIGTITVGTAVPTYQTATNINARITIVTGGGLTNNSAAIGRSASGNAYLGWSAEL
jgi:hypothetical protein